MLTVLLLDVATHLVQTILAFYLLMILNVHLAKFVLKLVVVLLLRTNLQLLLSPAIPLSVLGEMAQIA
jgi:hypothetical protein